MYTRFFGLKKKPFAPSPDPEFFYFSKGHQLAFTHLEYGLAHNVGFIALTGEVGTGKTTLLRYLLRRIRVPLNIAMIFNTQIDPLSFLEMLVKEFEITPVSNRKSDLYDALYKFFLEQYMKRSRCVIFVDEAQNLQLEAFEELRMLSNLDSGDEPLVQIILVGQPQLRARLAHASLEQLAQRISVHYHLRPLQCEDVGKYIDFRIHAAGLEAGGSLYEREAVDLIAEASRGVPRIINSICDASLTYAYADRMGTVSRQIVEKVLSDNELLRIGRTDGVSSSIQAPYNSNGQVEGLTPAGLEWDKRFDASGPAGLSEVITHLLGRIGALEGQMAERSGADTDRSIGILQEMLAREREKSSQFADQLEELQQEYNKVVKEVEDIRKQGEGAVESKPSQNTRTVRRFFSREKS